MSKATIPIKIYADDWIKLTSVKTYQYFQEMSYADIIEWLLQQDEVCDLIHKTRERIKL